MVNFTKHEIMLSDGRSVTFKTMMTAEIVFYVRGSRDVTSAMELVVCVYALTLWAALHIHNSLARAQMNGGI